MYVKTIEFEDFNGNTLKEDFYFHMTEKEVAAWVLTNGNYTLDKVLERYNEEKNGREIMNVFDDLLHRSYGRKSLDGRRFEKNEKLWEEFSQTEAYSNFYMELITDAKVAAEFFNGIIPKKMADSIEQIMKENPNGIPDNLKEYFPGINPAVSVVKNA